MKRLLSITLLAILLVNLVPVSALAVTSLPETSGNNNTLPSVVLIKLWEISHQAYMAKFVGEDYVVVFQGHGDVSLDGKYVSVGHGGFGLWVYKVSTGELLGMLTADNDDGYGDTWEVISWEPFQAVKVWDRLGFFSADSKRMVEDPRYIGTAIRVVDTTTWTTIPIDWTGFTDPIGPSNGYYYFYAIQLDYSGSTLAIGYIGESSVADTSKLLVFKYDPTQNKYTKIFEHTETGDYGRRLQMTLDGKYIVVTGLLYPYIDIWEWSEEDQTYYRIVHHELPDPDGAGALGISDPYNVGYVIIGTENGWVVIGHFDPETKQFKVIYQAKEAPDGSWFYNPFYERWIPKVTEVFALCSHRDSSRPGYGIVYDVLTNQTEVIHFADPGTTQWSAAAVSPEANYVFLGNALYMVVKRDIQSGKPRVRLWGTMVFERGMHELGTPIVLAPPTTADWHLYFYSGRVTISRLVSKSVPVTLTNDPDILEGKIGKLYSRGLVGAIKVVENSGSVDELDIETTEVPEAGFDVEHTIAVSSLLNVKALFGWNGHGFGGATVSSATVIDIPFRAPLDLYSEIKIDYTLPVVTVAPVFDWKKELLGVFGLGFLGGVSFTTGKALASKAAEIAMKKAILWGLSKVYNEISLQTLAKILRGGKAALQVGSKALSIVGIALIVDAGYEVYAHYLTYSSVRSFIINMAIVEDKYGNKYGAIALVLPAEEISGYSTEYKEHIEALASRYGLKDVGITYIQYGDTWKDYTKNLEAGVLPTIDLKAIIETTIASKYGYSPEELKIVGTKIIIETLVHGKVGLWDFAWGGLKVPVTTIIAGSEILPKAVTIGGRVYDDPEEIARLIGKVIINGIEFELYAGAEGAYADFQLPLGASTLTIDFGGREQYIGNVSIRTDVLIKSDLQPLGNFGYVASFHFNWVDRQILLERVEFADIPYPMYKVERVYEYSHGTITDDMTLSFLLSTTIDSNISPTGKFFYYVSSDPRHLDPTNGGLLQPCEKFTIYYFYDQPPDVSIKVLLNGTKVTSTLPHHATVVVSSVNAEQDVWYELTINVKYLRGLTEVVLDSETITDVVHVRNGSSSYRVYGISQYVEEAISFMNATGKVAFIEFIARITKAEADYVKHNNVHTIEYYPPPTIPSPIPVKGNASVIVRVYEYAQLEEGNFTRRPSVGAVVKAYYGYSTESKLAYTNVTDENGTATFVLPVGTWTFVASKPGYLDDLSITTVYTNNTPVILLLSPISKPSRENRTYVYVNATVTFHVYDGRNANPVPNADVTARLIEPTDSPYYNETFTAVTGTSGLATMKLPLGRYEVTVNASGYRLYHSHYIIDRDPMTVNIALVPETLVNFGSLRVIVIYSDWKPYEGAHVEIRNATDGSLLAMLSTNSFGNATVTLPLYQEYNVSVHVVERLYNREYFDYEVVNLTESDIAVPFVLPWESPQPAIEGKYYWLTVQVVWANGLPFHGAEVSVYNLTTGYLVDRSVTNGTGTVHFLLPAFKTYKVVVNATNPYTKDMYMNTFMLNLTDHRWITVRLPWTPPETVPVSKKYRLIIYAYDITTGEGVKDVHVVVNKGGTGTAWTTITNSTGYAEVFVPFTGLYNITGIHRDYEPIFREVYVVRNDTTVNLPLSPVLIPAEVPPPPINGTEYPPIVINETNYYWLSVQVLWSDGFPFSKALVTVYNLSDGSEMFQMETNGTGFVHFLIPENASIKVTVNATHPQDPSLTFYDERELNMTQHYYIVFTVPWESEYFAPEVWLRSVSIEIHRGLGYYFGNVSHLVLLKIWTNKPQNVTVHLELINASTNATVTSKDVTLSLEEGLNTFFEWLEVNASNGGYFRVFANITQWEYDTDPTNNWGWSDVVFLKPFVDIQVFVIWRPVEQKQSWTILPNDVIEIDVGIKLPINTTEKPARLFWQLLKYDLRELRYVVDRGALEDIRSVGAGIIWRNYTVVVPWTSKLMVYANVTHEWEDFRDNNFINVTIPIDPDVRINITERPSYTLFEGQVFRVLVNITSNVEPGKGTGWVSLIDNTTETLLKRVGIILKPQATVELTAKAPENPAMFWFVKSPATIHTITTLYAGYDLYAENNADSFDVTVISYQWATIVVAIIVLLVIVVIIRAVTHTIVSITTERRRFVRRRKYVKRRE